MRHFARTFLFTAVFLLASSTSVRAWRSTLYPADWQPPASTNSFETNKLIQDFSYAGYRAGEAPLPEVAGPVYNVAQAPWSADPTGAQDSTSAIQSAINAAAAAGGGVVYMPAGLFKLSIQGTGNYALRINSSKVVLRGAGTNQTFLFNTSTNMRSKSVILVDGPSTASFFSTGAGSTLLTQDQTGPATVLPVASVTGFSVGQHVVVRADATDAWITEHNEPGWVGYGANLRGTAYLRRVIGVDATAKTVTIDSPTRYYLKTRDNARIVRLTGTPLTDVGLEDFSIGNLQVAGTGWLEEDYNYSTNASYFTHDSFLVRMVRTRDSWIRRIASFRPAENTTSCHLLSNGLLLSESSRITVSATHFQRPQFGGGGGNGYMYRLQNASECLLQACSATFSRHGFVFSHMSCSGNVYHRCVDKDTGKQTGSTGSQNTSGSNCDHHMHFSHGNLIDACTGDSSSWEGRYRPYGSVPLHNLTAAHSVYWNTRGIGSGPSYVVRTEQSRYGYAIGTRGTRTGVDRPTYGGTKCNPPDHIEGLGTGDTLEPFSLYEDQLSRRLGLPTVSVPARVFVPWPSNSVVLTASGSIGGVAATNGFSVNWSSVSTNGITISNPVARSLLVTFESRGEHQLRVVAEAGGRYATGEVTVVLSPAQFKFEETLPTIADSYTRDGTYSDQNYGAGSTLQVKKSGTGFNRRAIFKFDLSGARLTNFNAARLELTSAGQWSEEVLPSLEAWRMSSDIWTETTVCWTNQPALSGPAASWRMSTNSVQMVDVTAAARQEYLADRVLGLAVQAASQPGDEVFSFRSRETGSGPVLVLQEGMAPVPYATWIAGFTSIDAASRGAQADPDKDGRNNAEEYLMGTKPVEKEEPSPLLARKVAEGLVVRFPISKRISSQSAFFFESSTSIDAPARKPVQGVRYATVSESSDSLILEATLPLTADSTFCRMRLTVE